MSEALRDRLQASLGDTYTLERKLGTGSSATVYLATDHKHRRPVAIKVLHHFLAMPVGLERFLREIEMTARLRHPNILPLFDSGEADGTLYFVMPFIDGESLRDRIAREGALPLVDALRFAREVGEALAYAHGRDVIHRDIKPDNILIDNGHAVVADFGIARALTAAEYARLTHTGVSLGTPLYMSPEQAFGEDGVEARSDQYSLACVTYEMLAGKPPFTDSSAMAILMRHLQDPPPSIAEARDDVPSHVAYALERAMAKAAGDRFPTMADWLSAIDGTTSGGYATLSGWRPAVTVRHSPELTIGVEPFVAATADADLTSIADGLTDDIAVGLSLFPYLTVVRGSSANPQYVLQGRVRRAGTVVRTTVQVVNRATGEQLWGETYDRELAGTDAFAVVDGLTDCVVATVADPFGVLVQSITSSASTKPVAELTPYEAVLLYYYYHQRPAPDTHLVAREAIELAVEQEPRNAAAWACLTHLYLDEDRHGFNPRPDSLPRALAAARKAIDADPTSAHAHHALAEAHFFRGEIGAFRSAAERSIALNRRDGAAVAMLGNLLASTGDWERGIALGRDAMARNPRHPGWYHFGAFFEQYHRGAYAEALATAERMNMPGYFFTLMALAASHAMVGNVAAARAARDDLFAIFPTVDRDGVGLVAKWLRWQPDFFARFVEGLERAEVVPAGTAATSIAGH